MSNEEQAAAEAVAPKGATADATSPQVPAVIKTDVAEFSELASGLSAMYQRCRGIVYDLRTIAGDKQARQDRKLLVSARTSLEKRRTELNAADRASIAERITHRDSEAARLTQLVRELEVPIDQQITADEERRAADKKARDEAERLRTEALRERISDIISIAVRAAGQPSAEIEKKLALVTRLAIDATFEEMAPAATIAKAEAILKLQELLAGAKRSEAAAAEAETNRRELERLREAERVRVAAEEQRQVEQRAEQLRAAQEIRDREEKIAREREAAALESQRIEELAAQTINSITRSKKGALTATAAGLANMIATIEAIATPPDLGGVHAQAVDQARAEALAELAELLIERKERERVEAETAERQRVEREAAHAREMLLSEIEGIRQQVIIAQVGRVPHYRARNVDDTAKILQETRDWPVTEEHFGALFHMAEAVRAATIQGLEQLLEQLRNPPKPLPLDGIKRGESVTIESSVAVPGDDLGALTPDDQIAAARTVGADVDESSPEDFIDHAMRLVSEVANVAKNGIRSKAVKGKRGPYLVPDTDFQAMCEALTRVPLPGGQCYAGDGTLMNADGTRSVFDDGDA